MPDIVQGIGVCSGAEEESPVPLRSTGGSFPAEAAATATTKAKAKPGQRRLVAGEVECSAETTPYSVLTMASNLVLRGHI